jgi:hypothetical protein
MSPRCQDKLAVEFPIRMYVFYMFHSKLTGIESRLSDWAISKYTHFMIKYRRVFKNMPEKWLSVSRFYLSSLFLSIWKSYMIIFLAGTSICSPRLAFSYSLSPSTYRKKEQTSRKYSNHTSIPILCIFGTYIACLCYAMNLNICMIEMVI